MRSSTSSEGQRFCFAPSDSKGPGATQFTRTPRPAHSIARDFDIASTPAFALAEWVTPAMPVQA